MSENKGKITREFCLGKALNFKPRNEQEAVFIQRSLFALGFRREAGQVVEVLKDCVQRGMYLTKDGIIYYGQESDTPIYSSDDFTTGFDPNNIKYLSGDTLILEAFNQLSQKMTDLQQEVTELKEEIKELKNPRLQKSRKKHSPLSLSK